MIILSIVLLILVISFGFSFYKVVNPNEAHVVIFMGSGRKIYAPTEGKKTAYFFIPMLMKRFIMPLSNVKMEIDEIELNDAKVAPFICDVIGWVHVENADKAVERLQLDHSDGVFGSLKESLINIVQSVARSVAMKHEILDIMRDRVAFSQSMYEQVNGVLDSWGIELVALEINDIRDDKEKGSTVISDYEGMRKAEVRSLARQQIALRDREAIEVEQENLHKSQIAKAEAEELYTKRQIEKDQIIALANVEREKTVALATQNKNEQLVEASRILNVGNATVERESIVMKATGEAEAIRVKGKNEAEVVTLRGQADASAVQARGEAEAVAKSKMAEAVKLYNDSGTNIEKIRAIVEIEKAKFSAMAEALSKADLKLIQSAEGGSLFGFELNASTGAALGQMLNGIDLEKVVKTIRG